MIITLLCVETMQSDIINRGVVFPCIFYVQSVDKYYNLYPMVTQEGGSVVNSFSMLKYNICRNVEVNDDSKMMAPQTFGSMYFTDFIGMKNYALSYYDSLFNTTIWTIESYQEKDDGGTIIVEGVQINGINNWENDGLLNSTIIMKCDKSVEGQDYKQTMGAAKVDGRILIQIKTEFACGHEIPRIVSMNHWVVSVYYICAGVALISIGYKILNLTLMVLGFFLGIAVSLICVLQGSNPNDWGASEKTAYLTYSLSMALILSYSSFYFPPGALYGSAIFVGYVLSDITCRRFEIKDRLYVAYLALIVALPILGILIAHKFNRSVKYVFTSWVGSMHLVLFYDSVSSKTSINSFADFIDYQHYINNPFIIIVFIISAILGLNIQHTVHSKTDGAVRRESLRVRDFIGRNPPRDE